MFIGQLIGYFKQKAVVGNSPIKSNGYCGDNNGKSYPKLCVKDFKKNGFNADF